MEKLPFTHLWVRNPPKLTMLTNQEHITMNIMDTKKLYRVNWIISASQSENKWTSRQSPINHHFFHSKMCNGFITDCYHFMILRIIYVLLNLNHIYVSQLVCCLCIQSKIFIICICVQISPKNSSVIIKYSISTKTKIPRTGLMRYYDTNDVNK